jgi:serine/threonine protein kinase
MVISKSSKPMPPSYFNKKVPRQLDEVALKALEKNPARRYQTVTEMLLDLRRVPLLFKRQYEIQDELTAKPKDPSATRPMAP